MVERNSKRGRKSSVKETKIMTIHTSKRAKLVINGQDEVHIPKNANLIVIRSI